MERKRLTAGVLAFLFMRGAAHFKNICTALCSGYRDVIATNGRKSSSEWNFPFSQRFESGSLNTTPFSSSRKKSKCALSALSASASPDSASSRSPSVWQPLIQPNGNMQLSDRKFLRNAAFGSKPSPYKSK